MSDKNTNAGALPSNAGDNFHLLWAAQKILEMLKSNSVLAAVTVEGTMWQVIIIVNLKKSEILYKDRTLVILSM